MSQVRLDHAERAEYTLFVGTIAAAALGKDWPEVIFGKSLRKTWCRRRESNPRPRDYETLALPLSYAGIKTIPNATESVTKVSSIREDACYAIPSGSGFYWKCLMGAFRAAFVWADGPGRVPLSLVLPYR
jgi:hypothetical protein